jgi:hypothetical protein
VLEAHDAGIFALTRTERDHRDGVGAIAGHQ